MSIIAAIPAAANLASKLGIIKTQSAAFLKRQGVRDAYYQLLRDVGATFHFQSSQAQTPGEKAITDYMNQNFSDLSPRLAGRGPNQADYDELVAWVNSVAVASQQAAPGSPAPGATTAGMFGGVSPMILAAVAAAGVIAFLIWRKK